jgi:hypothetical protein
MEPAIVWTKPSMSPAVCARPLALHSQLHAASLVDAAGGLLGSIDLPPRTEAPRRKEDKLEGGAMMYAAPQRPLEELYDTQADPRSFTTSPPKTRIRSNWRNARRIDTLAA